MNKWPARFLSLLGMLCFCCVLDTRAHAADIDCKAGTLVTVVAHLDDDLLFVEPAISEKLGAGWCVTTVHLIGGANGADFAYVRKREQGSRLAYSRMAGVRNVWDESTVSIAGNPVYRLTLKDQPRVQLLEMRLPGGAVRGGRVPLGQLWEQGATLRSYPMGHGELAPASYTRASLTASLKAILANATLIYTTNPDTVPFIEHPDHIYTARITRHVAQTLGKSIRIEYYVTYPTGNWPGNVYGKEAQLKRDVAASYFSIDGGDTAHLFGEYQWDGNWILRRYANGDTTGHAVADFVQRSSILFNTAANRCLTSAGNGQQPFLAPCDGSVLQQWQWQPRSSYPGNEHNAALVAAANGHCIAEHSNALAEEPCDEWEPSQRWTPWDFGLIYTPSRRCLGEQDGKLNIRGCAALTTKYRWSAARPTWATDLRLAGAMYADVSGKGAQSGVYIERRADGPGFDVYVQAFDSTQPPVRWYANVVPFDPRATDPTCNPDALCFDSVRFLAGDFDGDGRADLMAVTARNGGTAFWLMRNTGSGFAAPLLWYQTDKRLPAERVQQYVAFKIKGHSRSNVMLAIQRSDEGIDLWTVGADDSGRVQAMETLPGQHLRRDLHLLAVRTGASEEAALVAQQRADNEDRVTFIPISLSKGRWTEGKSVLLPSMFKPDAVKFSSDDLQGSAPTLLIATTPGAKGVDIWKLNPADLAATPVLLASLRDMGWQDATPALLHDTRRTMLVFYKRTDAMLSNTLFSAGNAAFVRYNMDATPALSPVGITELPAAYSETLWLERLAN